MRSCWDVLKLMQSKLKTDNVVLKIDLWELALQKLDEIPVPSNPPNDD